MDADGLHLHIDYVASSGVVSSVEQKAALQSSLVILKNQQKFSKIKFWGKILGIKSDYFLVQGVGKDDLKERKTLYRKTTPVGYEDTEDCSFRKTTPVGYEDTEDRSFSLDCVKWGLLQLPDEETQRRCLLIKGRFIGDPSHEYEYAEKKAENEESVGLEEEENSNLVLVKEEDRLATVVAAIDQEVAIVPRGAYTRTATGTVHSNSAFEGLSAAEAARLSSYFHFRDPILLPQRTLLQKAELDKAIDFLDPIDADIPRQGSWSIQFERGTGLVVLRSLHWIGFTFYHVPGSRNFGYIYAGTGEKNLDLPFML